MSGHAGDMARAEALMAENPALRDTPIIRPLLAENQRLRDALRPFADPGVWYTNYDGAGMIFRPDFYAEREAKVRIRIAREALAGDGE